jgi:hypothetical protein
MKFHARKICLLVCVTILIYLGTGLAFREYRMNPSNGYYGFYLPSSTPTKSGSEEETKRIIDALTRRPTLMERVFEPAEFIFNLIGI